MPEYIAQKKDARQRLDVFLASKALLSRMEASRQIKAGAARVNSRPVKANYLIVDQDRVSWEPKVVSQPQAPDLPVVYEDPDLLIVDKPAGLLSHPTSERQPETSVAAFAALKVEDQDDLRPGIVHRLDKDTSGLMIIAKHLAAKRLLQRQFKTRQIKKTYLVLVRGHLNPSEATIKLPIGRPLRDGGKSMVTRSGKAAITSYVTVESFDNFTLAEAYPETGRTHQIRVHLSHLGNPVAGDALYGPKKRPNGLKRQFLHASGLDFITPSKDHVRIKSALPEDLADFLGILKNFPKNV